MDAVEHDNPAVVVVVGQRLSRQCGQIAADARHVRIEGKAEEGEKALQKTLERLERR